MADSVFLDTSEVQELGRDLRRGADEVMDKAEAIVAKTAYDIESTAKRNLEANPSIDTGHLINSVGTDLDGPHARIGPTAEYGDFIEQGTGLYGPEGAPYEIPNAFGRGFTALHPGIHPEPYMGPAADTHAEGFELAMGALGEGILR